MALASGAQGTSRDRVGQQHSGARHGTATRTHRSFVTAAPGLAPGFTLVLASKDLEAQFAKGVSGRALLDNPVRADGDVVRDVLHTERCDLALVLEAVVRERQAVLIVEGSARTRPALNVHQEDIGAVPQGFELRLHVDSGAVARASPRRVWRSRQSTAGHSGAQSSTYR